MGGEARICIYIGDDFVVGQGSGWWRVLQGPHAVPREAAAAAVAADRFCASSSGAAADDKFRRAILVRETRSCGVARCAMPLCTMKGEDFLFAAHIIPLGEPKLAMQHGFTVNDSR